MNQTMYPSNLSRVMILYKLMYLYGITNVRSFIICYEKPLFNNTALTMWQVFI